ncbi:MAG: diguanylate cyclase domain-containing protein [Candidatus Competibacterales bacterium]
MGRDSAKVDPESEAPATSVEADTASGATTEVVRISSLHHQVRTAQVLTRPCLIVLHGPDISKVYPVSFGEWLIGRGGDAVINLNDGGVSRRHAKVVRQDLVVTLEDLQSVNGTFVNGERLTCPQRLLDGDKITLGKTTVLKFTYADGLDDHFQKRLATQARLDFLTGVYNRQHFEHQLRAELAYANRHGGQLAVIMLAPDNLAYISHEYGDYIFEKLLTKLASMVSHLIRAEDVLARMDGHVFAVICRGLNTARAAAFAARLQDIVARAEFVCTGFVVPVTLSVGVAAYPEFPAPDSDTLSAAATRALEAARSDGHNRLLTVLTLDD